MQNDWKPVPKMVATALGGALAVLIFWLLTLFKPEITAPPPVVAALTTIFAFMFGYLKHPTEAEMRAELNKREDGGVDTGTLAIAAFIMAAVALLILLFRLA